MKHKASFRLPLCLILIAFVAIYIYHDKQIVKDGIIPKEFTYESKGYTPECEGVTPAKSIAYQNTLLFRIISRN